MVHGGPSACSDRDITSGHGDIRRLEQRSIDYPAECPGVLVDQPHAMGDLQPGGTEQRLCQGSWPGREKYAVAWRGTDFADKPAAFRLREALGYRSARLAILTDQDVGQAAVPALPSELLPSVQLLARLAGTTRHHHRTDVLGLEHPEWCLSEVVRQLDQLLPKSQVGLVGAEAVHRVRIRQPWQRCRDFDADQTPDRSDQRLGEFDHVVLVDEAHLDVGLSELRVPIGPDMLLAGT